MHAHTETECSPTESHLAEYLWRSLMFLLLLNFPKTLNNWFKRVAVLSSRNLVIVTCHCERWSNAFTHLTFWTTSSGIPWFCALSYFCWLHFDGKGDCYVLHTQRIASHRIFFFRPRTKHSLATALLALFFWFDIPLSR